MPREILTEKDYQTILRCQNDIRQWKSEADRYERCGGECDERRERMSHVEEFFRRVLQEYFPGR